MNDDNFRSRTSGTIHLWPLLIVIAGIAACFAGAAISRTYWDFFGLLLILSLASLLIGVLFGFIFGIPKLNRNYNPRGDEGRTAKYTPNTNLEDVSDWLTKIIIGVTLTQLTKIPGYLQSIADHILLNNNCDSLNCDFGRPVIISLMIFFFIAGFIAGYYYTRLFLPNIFAVMEENSIKKAEAVIWREGIKKTQQLSTEFDPGRRNVFLTEAETDILGKIRTQNNRLTSLHQLSHREIAAVNVLRAKGILEEAPDDTERGGLTLYIADADVLQLFQI